MESAGIRTYRKRSGPSFRNNPRGVDWVAADKPQTYCPRLEGLVPWFLRCDV
jgi:hypothetical protein